MSHSQCQSLIRHVTDKTRILLLSHRGSQVSCQITRRDHRRSWSHKLDIFLLVLLLSIPSKTDAGFSCLTHCDCFYKSNKLIADCGSQGLQFLPQESHEEESKGIRADIQILNLTSNSFRELKANVFFLAKLVNLQRIYMSKVGLERLDRLALHPLANLVEVDLSWNSLVSVPSEAFVHIPRLRELDLSRNQIQSLPAKAFLFLTNLKILNLEKNAIRTLDPLSFDGLTSLESLKLSDNKLTLMDSEVLKPLTRLHSLTLDGNDWKCDCRLRQLRQFLMMTRRLSVYDEPKCSPSSSPSSQTIWTQMDLDSFICRPKVVVDAKHASSSSSCPSCRVIQVKQGNSLTLDCAFYVSEKFDELVNLPVKWFWQERPIGNNSRGILSNQVFLIHESETSFNDSFTERKAKVSRLEVTMILELNQGAYSCVSQNKAGSAYKNFSVIVNNGLSNLMTVDVSSEEISEYDDEKRVNSTSTMFDDKQQLHGREQEKMTSSITSDLIFGVFAGAFIVMSVFLTGIVFFARKKRIGLRQTRRSSSCIFRSSQRNLDWESELEKLHPFSLTAETTETVVSDDDVVTKKDGGETMTLEKSHGDEDDDAKKRPPRIQTGIGNNGVNPMQKPPRHAFQATKREAPEVWLINRPGDGSSTPVSSSLWKEKAFDGKTSASSGIFHSSISSSSQPSSPSRSSSSFIPFSHTSGINEPDLILSPLKRHQRNQSSTLPRD